MTEPCGRCGVRADVGCRHQPPEGEPPVQMAVVDKRRSVISGGGRYKITMSQDGQGKNFHRRKET
jgi:hypothetical protein